jgi:hypothetical protein
LCIYFLVVLGIELRFARQALSHLSYTPQSFVLFCFSLFFRQSLTLLHRLAPDDNSTSVSWLAMISGVHHHTQPHFVSFFWWYYSFKLRAPCFRQACFCLSTFSSPFGSGYFGGRVSLFLPVGPHCDLPVLCFPHGWDDRHEPPHPSFFRQDKFS